MKVKFGETRSYTLRSGNGSVDFTVAPMEDGFYVSCFVTCGCSDSPDTGFTCPAGIVPHEVNLDELPEMDPRVVVHPGYEGTERGEMVKQVVVGGYKSLLERLRRNEEGDEQANTVVGKVLSILGM